MISVGLAHPLRRFQPEIGYVFSVIGERLGLNFRIDPWRNDDCDIVYGCPARSARIRIPECFFSRWCVTGPDGIRLDGRALATDPATRDAEFFGRGNIRLVDAVDTRKRVLSTGAGRQTAIDLVGAIFFFLSRIEELDRSDLDSRGRFKPESTLAAGIGLLEAPVVDRLIDGFSGTLEAAGLARRPPASRLRVHLTHDVDRLRSYHSRRRLLRERAGDLVKRGVSPVRAARGLIGELASGEPYRSFRHFMDQAESRGLRAQFFFQAGSDAPMDADYYKRFRRDMANVIRQAVDRGHEIGFHPGFHSFDDAPLWQQQKQALEDFVGRAVTSGRQHVLRFHPDTWTIWEKAGMTRDYTLCFPHGITYRAGTGHGFPVYGLRERRNYRLRAVPTTVMDTALFSDKYGHLSEQQAFDKIEEALRCHAAAGGDIVLLFHTVYAMSLLPQMTRILDLTLAAARAGYPEARSAQPVGIAPPAAEDATDFLHPHSLKSATAAARLR